MKTCISCKWCVLNKKATELSKCEAPNSYERCVVTGGKGVQNVKLCSTQRKGPSFGGGCGPEASWWEEKPQSKLLNVLERIKQMLCYNKVLKGAKHDLQAFH